MRLRPRVGNIRTKRWLDLQNPPLDRTTVSDIVYVSGPSILALILGRALFRREAERAELQQLKARHTRELAARADRVLAGSASASHGSCTKWRTRPVPPLVTCAGCWAYGALKVCLADQSPGGGRPDAGPQRLPADP